ncbi:gliding motility-associated C-terminal domain-containing protein [bacterium]|nr:gliding motility-associated C-terminal domain-containing protein [bacterium]
MDYKVKIEKVFFGFLIVILLKCSGFAISNTKLIDFFITNYIYQGQTVHLNLPSGIAVDDNNGLYISDTLNNRIIKFNVDFSQNTIIQDSLFAKNGILELDFAHPEGIAVDEKSGSLFVLDTENHRICIYNLTDNHLEPTFIGSKGIGNYEFNTPRDIAIYGEYLYVADSSNHRIQQFQIVSGSLVFIDSLTLDTPSNPSGIAIDNNGWLYVVSTYKNKIKIFDESGNFQSEFGFSGLKPGEVLYPRDIEVDNEGNIFIVDTDNARIEKFESGGTLLQAFGEPGLNKNQFCSPQELKIKYLSNGRKILIIADSNKNMIQAYDDSDYIKDVQFPFGKYFSPNSDNVLDQLLIDVNVQDIGTLLMYIYSKSGVLLGESSQEIPASGWVRFSWNGKDLQNNTVPTGQYIVNIYCADFSEDLISNVWQEKVYLDNSKPYGMSTLNIDHFSPSFHTNAYIAYSIYDNMTEILRDFSVKVYDSRSEFSDEHLINIIESENEKPSGMYSAFWNGINQFAGEFAEEGSYSFVITCSDNAKNVMEHIHPITIDHSPPIVYRNIEDYGYYNYDVTPEVEIAEYIDLSDLLITLDGNPYVLGTPVLEEGHHEIIVNVTDIYGNQANESINFIIDKTNPVAEITSPTEDDLIGIKYLIAGSASDVNISYYELFYKDISLSGGFTSIIRVVETEICEGTLAVGDNSSLNGEYIIKLVVCDKAGNITEDFVNVNIDSIPPQISFAEIEAGEFYNYDIIPEISFSDNNEPLAYTGITLNGEAFVSGSTISKEGYYDLIACAVDRAGNESVKSISFVIDKTSPIIEIKGVQNNKEYTNYILSPKINCSDVNLQDYYSRLNANPFESGNLIYEPGSYSLYVIAEDFAGNISEKTVRFEILRTTYTFDQSEEYNQWLYYPSFGLYKVNRREIRMDIVFPYAYSSPPEIDVSSNGLEYDSLISEIGWAEVVPGSFKQLGCGYSGCTLRTYVYYRISRQRWIPCEPENVNFDYSINNEQIAGSSVNPFEYLYGGNKAKTISLDFAPTEQSKTFYIEGDSEYPIYDFDKIEFGENSNTEEEILITSDNRLKIIVSRKYYWTGDYNYKIYAYGRKNNLVEIETDPPESSIDTLASPLNENTDRFIVSWSGLDDSDGDIHYNIQYRVNNDAWQRWDVEENGESYTTKQISEFNWKEFAGNKDRIYFRCRAKDIFCNVESFPSEPDYDAFVDIDIPVVIPQTKISFIGNFLYNESNDMYFIGENTKIILSTFGGFEPVETKYRINEGSWQIYVAPIVITQEESISFEYYSVDEFGNSEAINSKQIFLDDAPPVVGINANQDNFSPNGDGCNDITEFSVLIHDDSGVDHWELEISNASGPVRHFSGYSESNFTITWDGKGDSGEDLPDGLYQPRMIVYDNVGNIGYYEEDNSEDGIEIDYVTTQLSYYGQPENITNNTVGNHSNQPIWGNQKSSAIVFIKNNNMLYGWDLHEKELNNYYTLNNLPISELKWMNDGTFSGRVIFIEDSKIKQVTKDAIFNDLPTLNSNVIHNLVPDRINSKVFYNYQQKMGFENKILYETGLGEARVAYPGPLGYLDPEEWLKNGENLIISSGKPAITNFGPSPQMEELIVVPTDEREYEIIESQYPGNDYVIGDVISQRNDLSLLLESAYLDERYWITNDSALEKSPVFSPDGTKIAYMSNADGYWNVWLVQRDIPYEGYIQPYNTDNFHPPVQLTHLTDDSIDINSIGWTGRGDKISYVRTLNDDPNITYIVKALYYMDYTGMDHGMLFGFKTKRENSDVSSLYEWSDQGHLVYSDYDEANDITDIKVRYMIWEDYCDPEFYNAPGDIVSSDGLVEVEIESDDLYQGMEYIEIASVDNVSSVPEYSEISGMVIGDVYEINSRSGINYFKDNIEIAFNYDDLTILGYDEANYQVYTYDEENSEWVIAQPDELLTTRDYDSNQITIEMLHLSYYALCYHHNEPGPPEILSISIAPEYLSPNGDGVNDSLVVSVSVSEESIVHLGIFNRDGDEIYWSEANAPNEIPITFTWNGKDLDNEPITDDGIYEVYLYARDLAGEYSDEHFTSFAIDLTSAQTWIEVNPINSSNEVLKGSMIRLHAEDALSGVQYTQYRFDDDEWRHYTESMNLASFGYGLHTIEYRSIDNTGNVESINSLQFEIVEAFDISADISVIPSILIWENFSNVSEDEHEQLSEYFDNLEGIITYDIVESSGEFVSGMRSGLYNEYIILGNAENLEGHTSEELREHVYSGKGLITSHYYHFLGEGVGPEVLGIRYSGVYDGNDLTVNLVNSPITGEGVLTTIGKTYTVESLGSFEGGHVTVSPHLPTPVIIGNNYGEGKTVYFAFDMLSSLEDAEDILAAAIDYVRPEEENVISGGYNTIKISVKSNVFDLQTKIREILPEGSEIIRIIPDGAIEANIIDWNELITAGETRKYYVFARLPETGEEFTFTAEVSYLANGIWWEEEPFEFTETVSYDPETLQADIIEMLNDLDVYEKEMKFIFNAIKCLDKIPTAEDKEKAILECLKAINNVRQIESTDIHKIRILLDQLLIEIS